MIAWKPLTLILFVLGMYSPVLPARAQTGPAAEEATDPTLPVTLRDDGPGHLYADIETSKGTIETELDFQHAPLTTMSFVGLAEGVLPFTGRPPGTPFFDGTTFHRVVKDFVVQGGDPLSADPGFPVDKLGDGGPGYSFPDEFSPRLRHDTAGVLSMANDGPDTNGSQFFITLHEENRLNYLHGVFGQVVRGLDVVNRIEQGDKILHVRIRRTGRLAGGHPAALGEAEPDPVRTVGSTSYQVSTEQFEALKKQVLAQRRPLASGSIVALVDETKKLPDLRVKNFNSKLANYERTTGHRIVVRMLPEFTPGIGAETAGGAVKQISQTLGLADTGDNALVCYFANTDTWNMRLGEATYPALIGETGTTEQLMANGALHRRKAELLSEAQALTKDSKPKEAVDAIIDGLIKSFDDFALKQAPPEKR